MSETESSETDFYAACPSCMSLSSKDTREAAENTAERHNKSVHGGDDVAMGINARDPGELREFLEAAEEQSQGEEFENFIKRMRNGTVPFFCPATLYKEAVPDQHK